ncbi:MAG: UDP-N-acetylmuramate--L-alanine ligase [Candidatus Staskawiczbacteria bacterium]|nr:UDP-N-acetylmuramate--L-alanine ligase [Candidatus Staskawiczbacteria bacterium]
MKIHLIGIGGIGVSALAQYYLSKGHQVSGSDLVASEITDFLKQKGIKIIIGNYGKNIEKDFDLVVHSPAVKASNPEFKKAKQLKIKTQSYPEALGDLTKEYYTIAVAGAHGKSTTTAMIGLVLTAAGLDPTVIVGTKVKEFGNSNFREGKSKLLVIEACEYDSSFLYYSPKIAVITNVDKEHLDYFKTFANVIKAFKNFILKLPKDGLLVFNADDSNIPVIENPVFKSAGYSLTSKDAPKIKKILKVPGKHNVSNALAVLEVARFLIVPESISFKAISEFNGTWRRFEIKQGSANEKKITVISDYGHHPNEIMATLTAAREKYKKTHSTSSGRAIWCVFQPHQHQRTHYLFNDFVKTFRSVPIDKIIITDIYDVAGRETKSKSGGVSSKKLVKEINKESVIYVPLDKTEEFIKENIKAGDVLIIMGAGDIYKLADNF